MKDGLKLIAIAVAITTIVFAIEILPTANMLNNHREALKASVIQTNNMQVERGMITEDQAAVAIKRENERLDHDLNYFRILFE